MEICPISFSLVFDKVMNGAHCLFIDRYRREREEATTTTAFTSQAYKDNPSRYNLIQFVKAFIISAACPFSIGENKAVKHALSVLCPKLDQKQLGNETVRFGWV